MIKYFVLTLSILLSFSTSFAAAPKLFFSDMTDGVSNGFDGDDSKGAVVSIWGLNFGSAVHTSYVSIGGQTLYADESSIAEWAATTNPTTPRGLQRITFYLNSSMIEDGPTPNTNVTVTTSEGTSDAIPFHVRSIGNIYFVAEDGNDTANGLTTSTPWLTFEKIRSAMDAGDVVYVRAGGYISEDSTVANSNSAMMEFYASDDITENYNSGTEYNSITVTSYPGESVTVGDYTGDTTDTVFDFIAGGSVTGVAELNYWTFSKFNFYGYANVFAWYYNPQHQQNDGFRIIGNDIRTTHAYMGSGIAINPYTTSAEAMEVYGNYFNKIGVPIAPPTGSNISTGASTGLTGTYNAKYTFKRDDGTLWQESEMSSEGTPVVLTNGSMRIDFGLPEYDEDLYTHTCVYRTKADGSVYYFDQCVTLATTYVDSTTLDSSLSTRTEIEAGYKVSGLYFGGGVNSYLDIGWNEFTGGNGTAVQVFGHFDTDRMLLVKFHDNYLHDNHRQSLTLGGGDPSSSSYTYLKEAHVYNNIIEGDSEETFRLTGLNNTDNAYTFDHTTEGLFSVYNNTIYKNQQTSGQIVWRVNVGDSKFVNNIIIGDTNTGQFEATQFNSLDNYFTADNNIIVDVPTIPTWAQNGMITSDPLMTDPVNDDFTLQASSPAIDEGTTWVIANSDFINISRPQGSLYDIGAYEFDEGDSEQSGSVIGGNSQFILGGNSQIIFN